MGSSPQVQVQVQVALHQEAPEGQSNSEWYGTKLKIKISLREKVSQVHLSFEGWFEASSSVRVKRSS